MLEIVSYSQTLSPQLAADSITFLVNSHGKLRAIAGVSSFCDTVKLYFYTNVKLIHVRPFMLATLRYMVSVPFLTGL